MSHSSYPLIGLIGPAGSGKSTVADMLTRKFGYRRAPVAAPLKQMLMAIGLTHDDVYGARKETPHMLLGGRTPRHAMQTLGTEWGRNCMDEDFWLRAWVDDYMIRQRVDNPQPVVADDVRFHNETNVIRDMGGIIVAVHRAEKTYVGNGHHSERGGLAADVTLSNTAGLRYLEAAVDELFAKLK